MEPLMTSSIQNIQHAIKVKTFFSMVFLLTSKPYTSEESYSNI